MNVYIGKSFKKDKKYVVEVDGKTIHFGSANHSDFTKHKDSERKKRYIQRHKSRENWNKSGIKTAGFWSRWLLWSKPTITEAKKYIAKRFNVKFRKY